MPEWVSDEMKDFVSKCLIRDPKQRWTTEEFLPHPYMAEAEEIEESPVQLRSSSKQGKWVLPKSTLESCLWDSEAKEDVDEEDKKNYEEIIQNLAASPPANWTWDDSWIALRGRSDEFANGVAMLEFEFSRAINGGELSGSGGMFFVERNGCENSLIMNRPLQLNVKGALTTSINHRIRLF
ncbi:hypothetical protein KSP40_PGU010226 [Platanthera guangdongensis]|uniref:Protein kinase domain-containing protein n=1 Tax=Platanthera guangdongensis TaxID=2320717 RepID=A0ABR2MKF5_9ASPA